MLPKTTNLFEVRGSVYILEQTLQTLGQGLLQIEIISTRNGFSSLERAPCLLLRGRLFLGLIYFHFELQNRSTVSFKSRKIHLENLGHIPCGRPKIGLSPTSSPGSSRFSRAYSLRGDYMWIPFPPNVLAFFLIISMRFHSIQKCYHKIIVRVPINLREFLRDF